MLLVRFKEATGYKVFVLEVSYMRPLIAKFFLLILGSGVLVLNK